MKDYSYLDKRLIDAIQHFYNFDFVHRCMKDGLDSKWYTLPDSDLRERYKLLVREFGQSAVNDGAKAVKNAYMRTVRVKRRIDTMLVEYPFTYFVTYTISNDYIELPFSRLSCCALSDCKTSPVYVLNEDHGDRHGRLHFHAVVSDIAPRCFSWPFGHVDVRPVLNSDNDKRRLARYQTKLARHAVKPSAQHIWFSRSKRK